MSLNVTYYSKLYSTESTTVVIDKDKATIAEVLSDMHVSKEHKRVFVNDMQVTDMSLEVSSNDIITVLEYVEDSAGDFFDGLLVVGGMILMGAAMMTGFGIPGALMLIGGAGLTTLGAADYAKRHFEAPDISVKDSVKDRPDLYGGKNSIHADAPIPVVLGTSLVSPYVVGDYWSEATDGDDGNDMYIHGLLCFGYGPLHLTNFKLGDSDLGVSMTDPKVSGEFSQILRPSSVTSAYLTPDDVIELEIRQGYLRAYDKNIYDKRVREELPNIEIVWANTVSQAEYMKMTPARMTARSLTKDSGTYKYKVGVVVGAQGFARYNKKGDSSAVPITIRLMWRAPGTETWQNFRDTSSYKVVDQKSTEKEVRYNLVGNYSGTLPQIEITVVRSRPNCVNGHSPNHSDTDTKDTYMDKWIWSSMRTHTEDPVFPDERVARQLCLVAIRAKATTNVNGSLDALNCIASSMLPSLNVTTGLWPLAKPDALNPNSAWATWTKTSNPADMYLAMFMGIYTPTSRVNLAQCQATGTRFAWDKLRDLWVWCNENRTITLTNGSTKTVKNCQYNRYITNAVKLKDMLDAILRFARAQYITEGPRYSLIHDAVYNKYASYTTRYRNPYNQIVSKALITPRNGKDFAVSKDYKETPDALKISIASAAAGYVKQQIVVRNPTITQAELNAKIQAGTAVFEEDTYEGITDAYIATMYAWYRFGVYIHRRVTCTLSTDIEHLFYSVGDRVSAATDVILTGYSYGRISTYIEDETGYDVVLDDSVEFPAGEALGIVIWSMSTGNVLPVPCTPVNATDRGDGVLITRFVRVNTKSTEIAESLGSDIYYVVGKLGSETKPWLVLAKERVDDDRAKLTLVEANPEVHNSDDGSIKEYEFDTSVIKGRSITDSSPASSQIQTPDPFASIGAVSGTVYVIENGDPAVTIPDNVHSVSVRASEAGLNISWGWTPSGAKPLANNVKRFIVDISRNAGVDWPVTLYPLNNEVTYAFDKDTDGLPTADDLVNYRVRVKAENAYSIVSPEYTPDDEGSLIDTTGFKGWEPLVPSLGFRVSGRMITVNVSTGSDWYGKGPFELQIAKGYSVLPNGEIVTIVSPDSLVWFAPALGVDPYASYENYKEGAEGAYIQRTGTSVTLVLPLYGQNEDPVSARDTPYYFRVRGTTIAKGEKLESVWSDPELTVAMATTATDVVRAWKLDDTGQKVKIDGALGAQQIYAEFLAAISANLGVITDGAMVGSENNMWAMSRIFNDDGSVRYYEGTVRMGGADQYLKVTPVVSGGVVVNYNIDFKVGSFTVTATGSEIKGKFVVKSQDGVTKYFEIDPTNGKAKVFGQLQVFRTGDDPATAKPTLEANPGSAAGSEATNIRGAMRVRKSTAGDTEGEKVVFEAVPNGSIGVGYQTVTPGTDALAKRIAIQPPGHVGGPWWLAVHDTASESYLAIMYADSEVARFYAVANCMEGVKRVLAADNGKGSLEITTAPDALPDVGPFPTIKSSAQWIYLCTAGVYSGAIGGSFDGFLNYHSNMAKGHRFKQNVEMPTLNGYSPDNYLRYEGWVNTPGYNANTIAPNRSGFTYANNAPFNGPLVSFAAGGYELQLNASYYNPSIAFRTHNGDNNTFSAWKPLISLNENRYANDVDFPIGTVVYCVNAPSARNVAVDVYLNSDVRTYSVNTGDGPRLSGVWRSCGGVASSGVNRCVCRRVG